MLSLPRFAFTRTNVDYSPEDRGVYALFDAQKAVIYIGCAGAEGIRACLTSHLIGERCACSQQSIWYAWELALYPEAREAELLAGFVERYKRRPACQMAA